MVRAGGPINLGDPLAQGGMVGLGGGPISSGRDG